VLALQREIHGAVARGDEPNTWLLVEHEPVITVGRNAKSENVLLTASSLAARGLEVVKVERGGDATYHGPGQLVVYPIVKLARFREIVPFISALEAAVVETLANFGIAAITRQEHRGVYVGDAAICSIGLAVKQMTSIHGFALNVSIGLDYDRLITPCGMPDFGITSISQQVGLIVTLEEARGPLIAALERRFALRFGHRGVHDRHAS
jgi:lipoate-protein ligase B